MFCGSIPLSNCPGISLIVECLMAGVIGSSLNKDSLDTQSQAKLDWFAVYTWVLRFTKAFIFLNKML